MKHFLLKNEFSKDLRLSKNARVQWISVLGLSSFSRIKIWKGFGLISSPIRWEPGYLPFLIWAWGEDFCDPKWCEICKVWDRGRTLAMSDRPEHPTWKAIVPDAPAFLPPPGSLGEAGHSFPFISWAGYITEKNKVGQEAAFSTSEETVRIHPFALMPKLRLPHPATLSRTHSDQRALGAFVPTLSRTRGNISLTDDKDLSPLLSPSLPSFCF